MNNLVALVKTRQVAYSDVVTYMSGLTSSFYIKESVRELFALLELDIENIDTENWNPLGFLIHPGDTVLLKPNLVKEEHEYRTGEWEYVITHGSIIYEIASYAARALCGQGKIIIADAPQTDSSFSIIAERLGLFYIAQNIGKSFGVPVEILDLRDEEWINRDGVIIERKKLSGDPAGKIAFDLGDASEFTGHAGSGRYYGADYDTSVVNKHHSNGRHEYLISATPIKADVVINLPKLKTHKKTGVTLSLKNMVGINADKNWLPHHTIGGPQDGGDQFPRVGLKERMENLCVSIVKKSALKIPWLGPQMARYFRKAGTVAFGHGKKVIRSGNWYGNDTTWRMVLDLNKCLFYGKLDGTFRDPALPGSRKRYFTVIDGIIGMEGDGPMQGEPFPAGVLLAGIDPVAVDAVAANLMGFDWKRLPVIHKAFRTRRYPVASVEPHEIIVRSNVHHWNGKLPELERVTFFHFKPHFGWRGHIEK